MQKNRNLKLLVILLISIIAVVVAYLATRPEDKLKVSRDLFTYKDPSNIDRVTFSSDTGAHFLAYEGNKWEINDEYKADPGRVSVLFAILKQMRVRRSVSKQEQEQIQKNLETKGTEVTFYEGDKPVKQFYIWGDEDSRLTYAAKSAEEKNPYIVEIPGYRNYLAGIFMLDANGWRDPLVFDMNWSNLTGVNVIYPQEPESSFSVEYQDNFYSIPEVPKTDSTKLVDFLDAVSLLYVNDYLTKSEEQEYSSIINNTPQASIQLQDVGKNVYTLELYDNLPGNKELIGRIDSSDYALFDANKVKKILRPARFFKAK